MNPLQLDFNDKRVYTHSWWLEKITIHQNIK